MSAIEAEEAGKEGAAVLQLEGISKDFGAIRALSEIDLTIKAGDVVGLMGDNGAGKSTLVKIIAGNFHPTHEIIRFDGQEHRFDRPLDARTAGIEVVTQDLALANNVSAAANVFLGRELTRRVGPFEILGPPWDERARPRTLRRTQVRDSSKRPSKVHVGRPAPGRGDRPTRLANAKLILMDEPTAAISVRQVAEVLDLIRRLRDQGVAVMLISHRMPDVFTVCDRVVVLRRGHKRADKPISQSSPEEVTALITGALEHA